MQNAGFSKQAAAFFKSKHLPFIGGKFVEIGSNPFKVDDSATGDVIAEVLDGGAAAVDAAVMAARSALTGPWSKMRPVEREKMMLDLAEAVAKDTDLLAEIESVENGKSIGLAKMLSVGGAVDWLRYYAGWSTKIEGSTLETSIPVPPGSKYMAMTVKEPVGVVGAIVPWNFPLTLAMWKIAPALACGCTIVVKPPEDTPLGCLRFAKLVADAGIPPGVINIVPGLGGTAGAALARHPGVDKITFTGSTNTGKIVAHAAVENMARFTLELGGKSPMVLMADMEEGAEGLMAGLGMFFNTGQVCTSASRLLIEKKVYDKTLANIAKIADSMTLGSGRDPDAQIQPVVSARHRDKINGMVERAVQAGAEQVAGKRAVPGKGHFVAPTILHNAKLDAEIVQDEVFGPVVAATPVKDLDEAIRIANDSRYGLSASIWTRDLGNAMTFAKAVKAGTVWVNSHNTLDPNAPFGGYKQSGIGREHGRAALEAYLETKTIIMRYA